MDLPSGEPFGYINGQFVPAGQLNVPVFDAGFVLGATVTEQLRTFHGKLFRLEEHFERLARSLEVVGVELGGLWEELPAAAQRLAETNHRLLDAADDLGLCAFVTPGPYATMAPPEASGEPLVVLHTYPLPFGRWSSGYQQGVALAITPVRQVPGNCWPAQLKCRSRMHYYLADRAAAAAWPGARALLLDQQGFVTETSTANVVLYFEGQGFVTPPLAHVLPGISLRVVHELARQRGWDWTPRPVSVDDVFRADEVILTSTPNCLLPVVAVDGRSVGTGRPGPAYRQLLEDFSTAVGVDIAAQAAGFSSRPSSPGW